MTSGVALSRFPFSPLLTPTIMTWDQKLRILRYKVQTRYPEFQSGSSRVRALWPDMLAVYVDFLVQNPDATRDEMDEAAEQVIELFAPVLG